MEYMVIANQYPDIVSRSGFFVPPWKSYTPVETSLVSPNTEADTWEDVRLIGGNILDVYIFC